MQRSRSSLRLPSSKLSTVEVYDTGTGPSVTIISPQQGRTTGGEPIAISGGGFSADMVVTIGGNTVIDLKVTDNLLAGITLSGTVGEPVIQLNVPGFDYTVLRRLIHLYDRLDPRGDILHAARNCIFQKIWKRGVSKVSNSDL